jgi:uncharacterized membrane protein
MSDKAANGYRGIYIALGLQAAVSVLFIFVEALLDHTNQMLFMIFNLFLAWIPLLLAFLLHNYLKKKPWISSLGIFLAIAWLVFLPNSFYIVSDSIHLIDFNSPDILVGIVAFFMMAINGLLVGLISVYLINIELNKRVSRRASVLSLMGIFLICGFAIYLGRFLRFNSWDVITNPISLIFDVSNPFFDVETQKNALTTCFGFFGIIGTSYIILWRSIEYLKSSKQ